MVRITPSILMRVEATALRSGLKPATLARMGLLEVVDRLGAQAPEIAPEIARAIAAAAERGVDVAQVLADSLEAKLATDAQKPSAQPTGTES